MEIARRMLFKVFVQVVALRNEPAARAVWHELRALDEVIASRFVSDRDPGDEHRDPR